MGSGTLKFPEPAAFAETFAAMASPRGRGGDLDPTRFGVSRCAPGGLIGFGVNQVRHSTIPANNRASFAGGTSVYPPDDLLVCDGTSLLPGTLMVGAVAADYGHTAFSPRPPCDWASRTGTIVCDVDAQCIDSLGSYVQISITEDPTPAPTFHVTDNHETGPTGRNVILVALATSVSAGARVGVSEVFVYTNHVKAQITASFELTGSSLPLTAADRLNHLEVKVSATHLQVWLSDYSTDLVAPRTFPNFVLIWEADITAPMTRGYVHYGMRIHSNIKFGHPATRVFHWARCGFDGPILPSPRCYEIPDNTTTGTGGDASYSDYPWDFMNLGYHRSDSPFSFTGVDLAGMSSALLTLQLFVQSITHTPDTTWGLVTTWNGGTPRTRAFTAAEVAALINEPGNAGYLNLPIPLTFADLQAGTNTLVIDTVNVPLDFEPIVQNIDLRVAA
jgi:hypothetical protein